MSEPVSLLHGCWIPTEEGGRRIVQALEPLVTARSYNAERTLRLAAEARLAIAVEALKHIERVYVQLVDCGDCGNWDSNTDPAVIAVRDALKRVGGP